MPTSRKVRCSAGWSCGKFLFFLLLFSLFFLTLQKRTKRHQNNRKSEVSIHKAQKSKIRKTLETNLQSSNNNNNDNNKQTNKQTNTAYQLTSSTQVVVVIQLCGGSKSSAEIEVSFEVGTPFDLDLPISIGALQRLLIKKKVRGTATISHLTVKAPEQTHEFRDVSVTPIWKELQGFPFSLFSLFFYFLIFPFLLFPSLSFSFLPFLPFLSFFSFFSMKIRIPQTKTK